MPELTFEVLGPPVPKQRPRFIKGRGGVYTAKRTREYEKVVRNQAWAALLDYQRDRPWETHKRYSVTVILYMADKRPRDLDNLAKAVTDAINDLIYDDDNQIDKLHVERRFDKDKPRAWVSVAVLDSAI